MNKDMEEKVMMLLRTISERKNWKLVQIKDKDGNWIENDLVWTKEHYNPMFVAEELLDEINE